MDVKEEVELIERDLVPTEEMKTQLKLVLNQSARATENGNPAKSCTGNAFFDAFLRSGKDRWADRTTTNNQFNSRRLVNMFNLGYRDCLPTISKMY